MAFRFGIVPEAGGGLYLGHRWPEIECKVDVIDKEWRNGVILTINGNGRG